MSEAQTIKTLIHEIAHANLHENSSSDKNIKEIEAESLAYITSSYFSIDTSEYSFRYVASFCSDKDLKELQKSLNTIQKESEKLITTIESKFNEISKSKDKENSIMGKIEKAKVKSEVWNKEGYNKGVGLEGRKGSKYISF